MKTLLLAPLFLLGSCIEINNHADGDGSATADKSQYTAINDPEWEQAAKSRSLKIIEVNAAKLQRLLQTRGKSVVVLTATWCGHCQVENSELIAAARDKDVIFVSVDYDLEKLRKSFSKYGYSRPVFVIASSEYGTDETRKTNAFLRQLTNGVDTTAVFPRHLVMSGASYKASVNERMTPAKLKQLLD